VGLLFAFVLIFKGDPARVKSIVRKPSQFIENYGLERWPTE